MADQKSGDDAITEGVAAELLRQSGLQGVLEQLGTLQSTLDQVAGGMSALGDNAMRQGTDVENLAAHVLAIEAVLTVILRQIPVDMNDVRTEAQRRAGADGGEDAIVVRLAEDLINRAEED